jgi:P27 family predicted phage terminase small subunit
MQGTFEPSKEGLDPISFNQFERNPSAPVEFDPHIQKHWNDLCTGLKRAGYLVKEFLPGLYSYCFAIQQRDTAVRNLIEEGFVITKMTTAGSADVPSPWLSVLKDANKDILNFSAKYGLNPLDVQKIPAVKKEGGAEMSLLK